MGFIPIILTMGGAILLFFMAVNQSLLAKKHAIMRLQVVIFEGFKALGADYSAQASISSAAVDQIDSAFRLLKSKVDIKDNSRFETQVKMPYRDLKVTIEQYNRLVKKKPYSFVAKLMGHKPI
jgi:hypothetical protein